MKNDSAKNNIAIAVVEDTWWCRKDKWFEQKIEKKDLISCTAINIWPYRWFVESRYEMARHKFS